MSAEPGPIRILAVDDSLTHLQELAQHAPFRKKDLR